MWVWTLNWGEIRSDLVIGSCPVEPSDIDRIHDETTVTAMLSLQTDECRAALGIDYRALAERASSRGIVLLNTPIRDFDADDQRKRLPTTVATVTELLTRGHRIYVHCTAGINRAPLVVLAYLTLVEAMSVPDAMSFIERGRPEARPCWDAYYGCREDMLRSHGARATLDTD